MPREVIIENSTFIINSYSSEDATETIYDILKRVIVNNAEMEFKCKPYIGSYDTDSSHDNCLDL